MAGSKMGEITGLTTTEQKDAEQAKQEAAAQEEEEEVGGGLGVCAWGWGWGGRWVVGGWMGAAVCAGS